MLTDKVKCQVTEMTRLYRNEPAESYDNYLEFENGIQRGEAACAEPHYRLTRDAGPTRRRQTGAKEQID